MNFLPLSNPEPPPLIQQRLNGVAHVAQPSITAVVETITPESAKSYLRQRNELNRNVSKAAIVRYARDMSEGRWTITGEAIIFDNTGKLIDGHHRLTAAVEHGVTFQSLVIRGVEPDAATDIDGGRARTAAHMAHMRGVTDAVCKCAIVNLLLVHERHGLNAINTPEKQPTKAEVIDAMKALSDLDVCVIRARSVRKLMPKSAGGFCYHVFREQNQALADKFWEELGTGVALSVRNPVLSLRNALIDNATKKAKLRIEDIIAITFKSWTAYRDGKRLKGALSWRKSGSSAEPFPQI